MQIERILGILVLIAFFSALLSAVMLLAGKFTRVTGTFTGYFVSIALSSACLLIPGWIGKVLCVVVFLGGLKKVTRADFFPDLLLMLSAFFISLVALFFACQGLNIEITL